MELHKIDDEAAPSTRPIRLLYPRSEDLNEARGMLPTGAAAGPPAARLEQENY